MEIIIDKEVYDKIHHWMDKAGKVEVSGIGKAIYEDGVYYFTSCCMCEQDNTGSDTEMKPESVAKAMYEMRDEPGDITVWWHSHHDMGVFWSGTDKDTIKQLADGGFILAVVFNNKHEYLSAIRQNSPRIEVLDVPTYISQPEYDKATIKQWDDEYAANFNHKKFTPAGNVVSYPAGGYGGYGGYSGVWSRYEDDYYFNGNETMTGNSDWKHSDAVSYAAWKKEQEDELSEWKDWMTEDQEAKAKGNINAGLAFDRGMNITGTYSEEGWSNK